MVKFVNEEIVKHFLLGKMTATDELLNFLDGWDSYADVTGEEIIKGQKIIAGEKQ